VQLGLGVVLRTLDRIAGPAVDPPAIDWRPVRPNRVDQVKAYDVRDRQLLGSTPEVSRSSSREGVCCDVVNRRRRAWKGKIPTSENPFERAALSPSTTARKLNPGPKSGVERVSTGDQRRSTDDHPHPASRVREGTRYHIVMRRAANRNSALTFYFSFLFLLPA